MAGRTAGTTSSSRRPTRTPTARGSSWRRRPSGWPCGRSPSWSPPPGPARSGPSGRSAPSSRPRPARWPRWPRWWCRPATAGRWRGAATVLLPASPVAEADGTFVNFEGRAQRFEAAWYPRGEARPHADLAAGIGRALGLKTPWRGNREVWLALSPKLAGVASARTSSGTRCRRPGAAGASSRWRPAPSTAGWPGRRNAWSPRVSSRPSAASRRAAGEEERVKRFFGMSLTLILLVGVPHRRSAGPSTGRRPGSAAPATGWRSAFGWNPPGR